MAAVIREAAKKLFFQWPDHASPVEFYGRARYFIYKFKTCVSKTVVVTSEKMIVNSDFIGQLCHITQGPLIIL